MKVKKNMAAIFCAAMCLSPYGSNVDSGGTQESAALVLAAFDDSIHLRKQVGLYNQPHADYQIEIKKV